MFGKSLTLVAAMLASTAVLADIDLPAKMEGKWRLMSGITGGSVIEVVQVEGPDKVQVKVTMNDVPSSHGAQYGRCDFGTVSTVAERSAGAWSISAPSIRCPSFTINIRPVEGKQQFEGALSASPGGPGSITYEWK